MNQRDLFSKLAAAARKQGQKLAADYGRPLGDKLAARLSKAGVERGLLQEPLDLESLLQRLKQLRDSGGISDKELGELVRLLKQQFLQRFGRR